MKLYLAARFGRMEELRQCRDRLSAIGIGVTSRWLNGGHGIVGPQGQTSANGDAGDSSETYAQMRARFAIEDLEDIDIADGIVAFTEPDDPAITGRQRGGRHVELGFAFGLNNNKARIRDVDIFVVGPRENVFCWLPEVQQFDTFDDLMKHLVNSNKYGAPSNG